MGSENSVNVENSSLHANNKAYSIGRSPIRLKEAALPKNLKIVENSTLATIDIVETKNNEEMTATTSSSDVTTSVMTTRSSSATNRSSGSGASNHNLPSPEGKSLADSEKKFKCLQTKYGELKIEFEKSQVKRGELEEAKNTIVTLKSEIKTKKKGHQGARKLVSRKFREKSVIG